MCMGATIGFAGEKFSTSPSKYVVVYTCPICSNGASTGFAPIHVKIRITLTIAQNFIFG